MNWDHVNSFLIAHGKSTVHRAECEGHFVLNDIISEDQLLLNFPTRPSNDLRCSVTLVKIEVTNALTVTVLMPSVCTNFQELCRIRRMLVWANVPGVHLTERERKMNKICAVEASRDYREADSSLLHEWQAVHRLRTEHCFNYTLRQKRNQIK